MDIEKMGLVTEEEIESISGSDAVLKEADEVTSATAGAAAGGAAGSLGGAAAGYVNR